MISFGEEIEQQLIELSKEKNIYLEGNIVKVISTQNDVFAEYLIKAKEKDDSNRKKRLDITKQIQQRNKELEKSAEEKESLTIELKDALEAAENAKLVAENDLDILQQKTQFQLIGKIVNVALWVICGVGITTTVLYGWSIFTGHETTLLGNTWSNMFGILLTNSFSIIGTIMGVKYATNDNGQKGKSPQ